jgi:hypothetical protein
MADIQSARRWFLLMDAIRLLSAPVDTSSTSEVESKSTSVVPASRTTPASRNVSSSDSAYPRDQYVWTVSVGDDGTFNFYAVPKQSGNQNSSSQWDGYSPDQGSNVGWGLPQSEDAVSQYSFYAALPASSTTGQYINIYA